MVTTVRSIMAATARLYGIRDFVPYKRDDHTSRARQLAMYLAREITGQSYPQLGAVFHRHHSTIMLGCDNVAYRLEREPILRMARNAIRREVGGRRRLTLRRIPPADEQ